MIRAYTSLPFNFISPIVGHLSTHEIPVSWRKTVLGGIASLTGMRMDEASEESFEAYPSFAALFNRELKEFIRPISACQLVSPADGRVLHFGEIVEGRIESVKERDYDIKDFIGPAKIETKPKNKLYQIVIYLAPADYHAFHSPASWDVNEKIHHPGFLLSVNPYFFNLIPTLLAINERVALCGKWKHGFFSYTAVAATNVGDIVIGTKSHKSREKLRYRTVDHEVFDEHYSYKKGEKVGEFRAGSTIVLIFEAPPELRFAIKAGDKLKYGQSLIVKDV
uniref:phosphatidylserine decarboxylase n=1 Tax=Acrobeloides nanus TaxID=290746 RepID=A0A914E8H2_9BILA